MKPFKGRFQIGSFQHGNLFRQRGREVYGSTAVKFGNPTGIILNYDIFVMPRFHLTEMPRIGERPAPSQAIAGPAVIGK